MRKYDRQERVTCQNKRGGIAHARLLALRRFLGALFGFGGLPSFNVPTGMSQFGCLQLGQRTGLPFTRLTQA